MFAIIETGSKQYKVSAGDKLKIERTAAKDGKISFGNVLLVSDGDAKTTIGAPFVKGASVEAKLVKEGRARKLIVFKYHSKTRQRKKKGHRQEFSEVEITKISV